MNIGKYFEMAIERNASDLHLVEGSIPALRISGDLVKLDELPIPFGELKYAMFQLLEKHTRDRFIKERDIDLSMEFSDNQFRVNLHFQGGKLGLTARLVPNEVPKPEDIGLTDIIYKLTHLKDGLVLVTGPSGSGKSTTLAVMLDIINAERRAHIITIEDPIEYVFEDKQSIIEQRQLGRDTESFAKALKYALRQDPNIIMVGEMRDKETVQAALAAAKTGHLVLSTLHTSTAPEAVQRIIDFFPSQGQGQIASQLAIILRAVIAQQLLPAIGGGLVCAREILINTRAVSNSIRRVEISNIFSAMQTGAKDGMITMNNSIKDLLINDLINDDVAKNATRDLETYATYY